MRDMTRCYSGLHFMNTEELDAALKETHEQVSEVGMIFLKMRFTEDVEGRVSLTYRDIAMIII